MLRTAAREALRKTTERELPVSMLIVAGALGILSLHAVRFRIDSANPPMPVDSFRTLCGCTQRHPVYPADPSQGLDAHRTHAAWCPG